MRLSRARIQNYRSVRDTGWFDLETGKTILVGPNEAGKSAILAALQKINPPEGVEPFDPLKDFPRSEYNRIQREEITPSEIVVAECEFYLEADDLEMLPDGWEGCIYYCQKRLDNSFRDELRKAPDAPTLQEVKRDLNRVAKAAEHLQKEKNPDLPDGKKLTKMAAKILQTKGQDKPISASTAKAISELIEDASSYIDPEDEVAEKALDRIESRLLVLTQKQEVAGRLRERIPLFILFNNYFRVRPNIHLKHLAERTDKGLLDDSRYDYGNNCLLKLLGFSARELADLGEVAEPGQEDHAALSSYRSRLTERRTRLNSASVQLTKEIREVWAPDTKKDEASTLRIAADRQYLTVVVEDSMGVEVELDQRSEGFQWLVSFFVVFFAESEESHRNSILLLDEPGVSLHALKQKEFRKTVSRLADKNQTVFTTHSPFMVGSDELDMVRVVELKDRETGSKVHTSITARDPAALLPLQEALGYDLAQSLFSQKRNLILEGLTDYWYLDGVASLARAAGLEAIDERIALIPSNTASKVAYFATILHAQDFKVAALLDSDAAGEKAAQQETLIHTLGSKRILRTGDICSSGVAKCEIEDLLRDTLPRISKDLGWDIDVEIENQGSRPLMDIYSKKFSDFSKYRLAKAFLRWTREGCFSDLSDSEQEQWSKLMKSISLALPPEDSS